MKNATKIRNIKGREKSILVRSKSRVASVSFCLRYVLKVFRGKKKYIYTSEITKTREYAGKLFNFHLDERLIRRIIKYHAERIFVANNFSV